MLTTGKLIDSRYLVLEKIGSGGFGAVFLAEDTRFTGNNRVAIKQISQTDDRIAKSFRREADLLFHLNHPNLPKVTNCFQQDDANFIVMDYISGEDLAQSLIKGKRFSAAEVLRIAKAVLGALEYLHENNIFHRDIKPHNIKIDADGKIFLLDFGTAKGAMDAKTLTLSGQSITGYTPFYAPLEQVLRVDANSYLLLQSLDSEQFERFAEKRTDARSDIYSFGATLYHLLTNYSPERATATIRAHAVWSGKSDPLPQIQSLNPEIPARLAQIVHRALELEPENRFQTAKEFAAALKNFEDEQETFAGNENFLSVPTVPLTTQSSSEKMFQENGASSIPTQTRVAADNPVNFVAPPLVTTDDGAAKQNSWKFAVIASLVFSLVILSGLATLFWWENSSGKTEPASAKTTPTQTLSYSLLVQKMRDGKKFQEPFASSGQEIFESGYEFQMRFTPPFDGYLYIFAEGLNDSQEKVFNIIFPTPERNGGRASVAPAQDYETGWNQFSGKTGTENFWLVWDKTQPEIVEKSRENAFQNAGKVLDKDLSGKLRDYLATAQNAKPEISKDAEKKLTKINFDGDSLVYLIQLEHR